MSKRTFRLGIDYGTSTSKMILRDPMAPGGEKAFLLRRGVDFRISSSVFATECGLQFGSDFRSDNERGTWYHSLKMRVAGECTGDYDQFCFGPRPPLPPGLSARDLAVLTIWFLAIEAQRIIGKRYRLSAANFDIAFTVGIPMSFYEDHELRSLFLHIARDARWLYDNVQPLQQGCITIEEAQRLLASISNQSDTTEVRNWIRSEAEAAMCLPVKSPSVADGPYAEVDIGAGTTNATIFSVLPRFDGQRWLKERLAFFSARSEPMGMDAFDVVLADQAGIFATDAITLRGRELEYITEQSTRCCAPVLSAIRDAYVSAWRRAFPKLHLPEREAFRNHQVFVTGGGSLIPLIVSQLRTHPSGDPHVLQTRTLEMPSDLWDFDGQRCRQSELTFAAAAYGLTFDALDVPEADTPDMIPEVVHRVRPRLDWEGM